MFNEVVTVWCYLKREKQNNYVTEMVFLSVALMNLSRVMAIISYGYSHDFENNLERNQHLKANQIARALGESSVRGLWKLLRVQDVVTSPLTCTPFCFYVLPQLSYQSILFQLYWINWRVFNQWTTWISFHECYHKTNPEKCRVLPT